MKVITMHQLNIALESGNFATCDNNNTPEHTVSYFKTA